jgi:Bacterial SH3 domain
MMAKLLKIVTVASTAVVAGGFAFANVNLGDETQSVARQDSSVILALAPPHRTLTTETGVDPAVDLAPSLPRTPPKPQRAPTVPTIDMASDETPERFDETAVAAKPALVRSGPSEAAPMLYAFPAGRTMRVIERQDGFAAVQDVRSGARGWIATEALASNLMTAATDKSSRAERHAKAEIKTPQPTAGIPNRDTQRPMLLGGAEPERVAARAQDSVNFASFVRRGFGQ